MNAIGKELARVTIDAVIALSAVLAMIAAVAAEGYYMFWPALSFCVAHKTANITGCDSLTLVVGLAVIAFSTIGGVHAGASWLQKFLRQQLPNLDWA